MFKEFAKILYSNWFSISFDEIRYHQINSISTTHAHFKNIEDDSMARTKKMVKIY